MRGSKEWRLLHRDEAATERMCREIRIPPVLGQLLINRGIQEPEAAKRYLSAPLSDLHDPAELAGVTEAASRLYQAARDGKRICVYGDYDVDGITATTLLWRCLTLAGAKEVDFYVPHRLEEGYGLNCDALNKLARQGFHVVVTVDCGITSVEEARLARELGIELIITDHHEHGEVLPDAAAIVHPRLPEGKYPFGDLCGVGVAFKVAWAICREFSRSRLVTTAFREFLLESMALVALGTVADAVPLVGENRIFVRHGLRCLRESPSIGLRALLQASQLLESKRLDAGHIGFQLAPRINAVGRLGQARLAVELLATPSEQRAADLARHLNQQNELRQQVENRILRQAREQIEQNVDLDTTPALVLSDDDWHVGVIGIVAGRLAARYARPVLLISTREEPGQGSGRSVPGFHLQQALAACRHLLLGHGGHAMAAGFRIAAENVDAFRDEFCSYAAARLDGRNRRSLLTIDAEIPLNVLTLGLMRGIEALEPHGLGNQRPMFLTSGLKVVGDPRKVGGGERHLSFRVRQNNGPILKAIAFDMADRVEELMSHSGECCLVYHPKINEWQGRTSIDLEVADLRPGPHVELA